MHDGVVPIAAAVLGAVVAGGLTLFATERTMSRAAEEAREERSAADLRMARPERAKHYQALIESAYDIATAHGSAGRASYRRLCLLRSHGSVVVPVVVAPAPS